MLLHAEKVNTSAPHRLMYASGLVIAALFLSWIGEGFPPLPWRLLFDVLPQLPLRLHTYGFAAGAAFLGTVILSIAFLVLWLALGFGLLWFVSSLIDDRKKKVFPLNQQRSWMAPTQTLEVQGQDGQLQKNFVLSTQPQRPVKEKMQKPASTKGKRVLVPTHGQEQQVFISQGHTGASKEENSPLRSLSAQVNEPSEQATLPVSDFQNTLNIMRTESEACKRPQVEMSYCVSVASDPGISRRSEPNEDAVFALQSRCETATGSQPVGLFVVADGMGGHANGREASYLALEVFSETIRMALLSSTKKKTVEKTYYIELLEEGIQQAATSIFQCNKGGEPDAMMGTTLTAALLIGHNAYIVNVGDSRTYILRQGQLRQITRDHSRVAKLVDQGILRPEDMYTHPYRSQIYRCLGHQEYVECDIFQETLQDGDALLLCSDGLWEMVRDSQIEEMMRHSLVQPSSTSAALLHAALEAGGADNVSIVVVAAS